MKLTTEELKAAKAYAKKHGHSGRKGGWIFNRAGKKIIFGWEGYYKKYLTPAFDPTKLNTKFPIKGFSTDLDLDPILPKDWGKITNEEISASGKWTTSTEGESPSTPLKLKMEWKESYDPIDPVDILRQVEHLFFMYLTDHSGTKEEFINIAYDIHTFLRSQ